MDDNAESILRRLVNEISRKFYDAPYVIILDTLTYFPAIKDEQLEQVLQIPRKELNKYIATLRDHKLIKTESKNEKETETKTFQKTYIMIDYKQFVDVVKFRIRRIREAVDESSKTDPYSKAMKCTNCKFEYETIRAAQLMFVCEICKSDIAESVEDEQNEKALTDEHRKRLNEQLESIIMLLKKTEEIKLEEFHSSRMVKQASQQIAKGVKPRSMQNKIRDVSNLGMENEERMDINIELANDMSHIDKKIEAEKKRAENALPVWHTHSTVTGEAISHDSAVKSSNLTRKDTEPSNINLAQYYATLNSASRKRAFEEDNDEEEDNKLEAEAEDDDFQEDFDEEEFKSESKMISVGGVLKPLADIKDEDIDKMTPEEYHQYYEMLQ